MEALHLPINNYAKRRSLQVIQRLKEYLKANVDDVALQSLGQFEEDRSAGSTPFKRGADR
jgi:hypothetical protein